MKRKVSVIGAGNVGATLAGLLASSGLSDIILFDIVEGIPQGKALDMAQACPIWGSSVSIKGTNDYKDTGGSDIVVITAGAARKPGMSRDDLLHINAGVVKTVTEEAAKNSPSAVLIVVTNPMDAMTYLSWKTSGFPAERVFGMGGELDSARLRAFAAWEAGVSACDVEAIVLGGHGDQMVPLPGYTKIKGIPISELFPADRISALMERTKTGGAEIVSLLKSGSAYYAPAAAAFDMVKAVLLDERRIFSCAACLGGEYGASGVYAGVPAVIGEGGVKRIIELELSSDEKSRFEDSVSSVRELIGKLKI